MKARIIKNQPVSTSGLYSITHKAPQVHGAMKYQCQKCGKQWWMSLEVGVEDFGKNGRTHQPCPFCIPCECGGIANDISGCVSAPAIETLKSGVKYFAYDKSGKEDACGKMAIYIPDKKTDNNNEIIANAMKCLEPFEVRDLVARQQEEIESLKAFKSYFDELYGTGLEIANWHKNGELEPFDNFYESAIEEMEGKGR